MSQALGALQERVEAAGFEVFDVDQAQRAVDARTGPLARFTGAAQLQLNRPAYQLLKDATAALDRIPPGASVSSVVLLFDAQGRRIAVAPAPAFCPAGRRQHLDTTPARRGQRGGRPLEWPAAVDVQLFLRVHDLRPSEVRGTRWPVTVIEDKLVIQLRPAE